MMWWLCECMMLLDKKLCHQIDLWFLNYRCINRYSCLPSYHQGLNSYKLQRSRCTQTSFEISSAMWRNDTQNISCVSDDVWKFIIPHRTLMFCSYLQFHLLTLSPLLHPTFLRPILYPPKKSEVMVRFPLGSFSFGLAWRWRFGKSIPTRSAWKF